VVVSFWSAAIHHRFCFFGIWSAAIYRRFCFVFLSVLLFDRRMGRSLSLCARNKKKTKAVMNHRTPNEKQ
jgi:hypothetical protein